MRALLLGSLMTLSVWAAEIPVDLKAPSDGARISNPYNTRDLEVELRVTWSKGGTVLDTVGINAAPTGSLTLALGADGTFSANVYDRSRQGGTNAGNGWQVMNNPTRTAAGQPVKVILKLKDGKLALLVGDTVQRWDCPTALSGQPIYVGDFKGDEAFGSKYNIYRSMIGQVVLVYFGASRAAGGPTTPVGSTTTGSGLPKPATEPILDEVGVLSAVDREQLADGLARLRARGIALGLVVSATVPTDAAPYRQRFIDRKQLPQLSAVLVDYADRYVFAYDTRFADLLSPAKVGAAWKQQSALPAGKRLLAVMEGLLSGRVVSNPVDPVKPIDPVKPPVSTGSLAGDGSALEAALKARDVAGATSLLAPEAATRCRTLFTQRPEAMAQLATVLATRRLVAQGARMAEYEVTDAGRRYPCIFELIDGRWCLSRF